MSDEVTPVPLDRRTPADTPDVVAPRPLILVVDDDADTRNSLAELLTEHGYRVVTAEDGEQAYHYLAAHRPPAAMVLDLWMPVRDGWSLSAEVMVGHLPAVPIVVVTAAAAHFAYPVPSRQVLRKPISPDRLLRMLDEIVRTPPPRGAGS
jgi:two-component system, chemotaxis family, chemotaxis protein CheY